MAKQTGTKVWLGCSAADWSQKSSRNKHVESIWFPCLDAGSTPASSTFQLCRLMQNPVNINFTGFFVFYPCAKESTYLQIVESNSVDFLHFVYLHLFAPISLYCSILHFERFCFASIFTMLKNYNYYEKSIFNFILY